MVLLPTHLLTKPVEKHDSPDKSLPDATHQQVVDTLGLLVDSSDPSKATGTVPEGLSTHTPMHKVSKIHMLEKYIPGIEKVASEYHVGNFVAIRGSDERFFESMPLYPRCVTSPGYLCTSETHYDGL